MTDDDVIVVGAGPTGLMLACELAMRGIAVRVLERRTDVPNITRAFAVHASCCRTACRSMKWPRRPAPCSTCGSSRADTRCC
jgi:2-polyprenyl-6-methoxyphenol hydroxylase-like FAD-dependent oxidoreductase